ncbi:MAG: prolipoprotein diacylglyceryl transferase [Deltaproteobacteria bacterium]|nr:prolipoprotein diacylglyceryl transferase [Deltaproteobacteria bacterium]
MHPILFHFGIFTIYTYGFFIALGVISGITLAKSEAGRIGIDPDKIMDLCFYIILFSIIGARLFYVATNLDFFSHYPIEIIKIWNGGLVFYGGFIAALITAVIVVHIQGLPFSKTADIAGLSVPLGQFLGRLGCLSAGCCYGKACNLPWAITFHNPASLARIGIPLHPTQIYSAVSNLTIFIILFLARKHKRFDGQIFWLYVLMYGVMRSIIEIFRGDFRGAYVFGMLSISQAIGLSMAVLALVMLIVLYIRSKRSRRDPIVNQQI